MTPMPSAATTTIAPPCLVRVDADDQCCANDDSTGLTSSGAHCATLNLGSDGHPAGVSAQAEGGTHGWASVRECPLNDLDRLRG